MKSNFVLTLSLLVITVAAAPLHASAHTPPKKGRVLGGTYPPSPRMLVSGNASSVAPSA